MKNLTFCPSSEEHARDVLAYRTESLRAGCDLDGAAGLGNFPVYAEWLRLVRILDGARAEKYGYYRTAVRLAFDGKQLAGILNVRRSEDPFVRTFAGHIGYHVRPSCRRMGYGRAMAEEAVRMCREYGIEHPVICTLPENVASRRLAESVGFVYTGIETTGDGISVARYEMMDGWMPRSGK